MKATLPDGTVLTGSIEGLCTGYVSDNIELEARDVRYMLSMLKNNPDQLRRVLEQLENRYPVNRIGGSPTGRLAPSHPNLQNILVNTEDGRKIKEAFSPILIEKNGPSD